MRSGDAVASGGARSASMTALLWLTSAAVLLVCVLAAFRRGFADDWATAWMVNGPRVLFGAGIGAALGLAGALRLARNDDRPLFEMHVLACSIGAAGAGLVAVQAAGPTPSLPVFVLAALLGVLALNGLILVLDRSRRWTNPVLALLLAAMAGIAAFAGTYARERTDVIAPAVTWLLGDLGGTTFTGAAMFVLASALLLAFVLRAGAARAGEPVAIIAMALAIGAAGPLAFVGTFAPRAVRWLARGANPPLLLMTSMLAAGATVAAVDAVPRLLVGGYDFPWNLPAAMLAIPIFLGWNRYRLRRIAGPAHIAFEIFEILLIGGMTAGGIALVVVLARVIGLAT